LCVVAHRAAFTFLYYTMASSNANPSPGAEMDSARIAVASKGVVPAHAFWYRFLDTENLMEQSEKYEEVASSKGLDGYQYPVKDEDGETTGVETFFYKQEGRQGNEEFVKLDRCLRNLRSDFAAWFQVEVRHKLVEMAKEKGFINSTQHFPDLLCFLREMSRESFNKEVGTFRDFRTSTSDRNWIKAKSEDFSVKMGINIQRTKPSAAVDEKGSFKTLTHPQLDWSGHALWKDGIEVQKKVHQTLNKMLKDGKAKALYSERAPQMKREHATDGDDETDKPKKIPRPKPRGPCIVDANSMGTRSGAVESRPSDKKTAGAAKLAAALIKLANENNWDVSSVLECKPTVPGNLTASSEP